MPPPPTPSDPGSSQTQVEDALEVIVRWTTRPEIRRSLRGAATLSATELWLVDHLERFGPSRMSDLARWQGVDRSTITGQVARLESRELVRRTHSTTDRRAVLVEVTGAGAAALEACKTTAETVYQRVLEGWSARDRDRFAALLTRFAAELDPQ